MKKITISIIVILSLVLQGCATKNTEPLAVADISGVALNVVTSFGETDGYHDTYQGLLKDFQDSTGAVINDSSDTSNEAWKESVVSSFDMGNEPDVLFFFSGSGAEPFVANHLVVDFETIRQYAPDYAMNINLGVLNTMKAKDGLNYSVPVTGFWEGLFINSDLFEKHDIKVPENMDELYTAIESFRKASIVPIAADIRTIPHYWFEYLLFNYTGPSSHAYEIPDDPNSLPQSWIDGLSTFQTLYSKNAFPDNLEDVTDSESIRLFNNKEAAMLLAGSWTTGAITDTENVKIAPVPAVDTSIRKPTDIVGGFSMGFYITKKAWDSLEKRDAAISFVVTMTNETALSRFNAGGAASPGPITQNSDVSPLIASGRAYVEKATAFVPAVQDSFTKDAREYMFSEIINIAYGEADVHSIIEKFIILNKE